MKTEDILVGTYDEIYAHLSPMFAVTDLEATYAATVKTEKLAKYFLERSEEEGVPFNKYVMYRGILQDQTLDKVIAKVYEDTQPNRYGWVLGTIFGIYLKNGPDGVIYDAKTFNLKISTWANNQPILEAHQQS